MSKALNSKDLKNNMDNAIIIDVRSKGYFLLDHIKNAINIESVPKIAQIANEHRDKKVILYCHKGITARKIAEELAQNGVDNVYFVNESFGKIAKSNIDIVYYNKE